MWFQTLKYSASGKYVAYENTTFPILHKYRTLQTYCTKILGYKLELKTLKYDFQNRVTSH